MFKNSEGYADPTAETAMSKIFKEYLKNKRKWDEENRRIKVYVASKYAGDVDKNTQATINYCRQVVEKGCMPIASHLLYPQILDDNNPAERELGLLFGRLLLRMCDEVWVFGDISQGMEAEIIEAKQLKRPIRYFEGA